MVRILVVDDDRNTRKLFSEILAAEGYDVVSAANGVEALECMETVNRSTSLSSTS